MDLRLMALTLACETCGAELDLPGLDGGTSVCTACGVAFVVDAPYGFGQRRLSA